ncbi:MAG: sensor domain-containing diguanylate cyclase [Actinomycetota bacterium]|nr:sensor domain-containing diguanylate cyclase [Actinomycetota bacterium]
MGPKGEEIARLLLDLTHDAVMALDADGTIAFWNRGAEEIYGFSREEALGSKAHTLLETRFPKPLQEIEAEAFGAGRWEGELVHTSRGGGRVVAASRWVVEFGENGEPAALLRTDEDVTERKRAEERFEKMRRSLFEQAREDPLTRLGNRRRLQEDLGAIRARVERYGHAYSALFLDVDLFKGYNDRYGHSAGDEVLRRVTGRISDNLRAGDTAYRYGGEEFLVLLPDQGPKEAALVAERMRRAVEDLGIVHEKSPYGVVTVSVGVARLPSGEPETSSEELLAGADAALYRAKQRGRNRVASSSPAEGD